MIGDMQTVRRRQRSSDDAETLSRRLRQGDEAALRKLVECNLRFMSSSAQTMRGFLN